MDKLIWFLSSSALILVVVLRKCVFTEVHLGGVDYTLKFSIHPFISVSCLIVKRIKIGRIEHLQPDFVDVCKETA